MSDDITTLMTRVARDIKADVPVITLNTTEAQYILTAWEYYTAPTDPITGLDLISRLSKDIKSAAVILNPDEARFLVDAYYAMQRDRIRAKNQLRALSASGEPNTVMVWLGEQRETLEKNVARALDAYSNANLAGEWARSITGIGPIIAAGLLAHVDIHKAPTCGHIWRYAGLDPTSEWLGNERAAKLIDAVIADQAQTVLTPAMVKAIGTELDIKPLALNALIGDQIAKPIDTRYLANLLNVSEDRIASIISEQSPSRARSSRIGSEVTPAVLREIANTLNMRYDTIMGRLFNPKTEKYDLTKMALTAVLAKRPWNASLKRLCFLIGESFVKVAGLEEDVYGKVFLERKEYEGLKNDAGDYAAQADKALAEKNYGADTDARAWYEGRYPSGAFMHWTRLDRVARQEYPDDAEDVYPDDSMTKFPNNEDQRKQYLAEVRKLRSKRRADQSRLRLEHLAKIRRDYLRQVTLPPGQGVKMLPPARIHRRACRKAVKLFLSHFHHVLHEVTFNKPPPKPYILDRGGHTHFLKPPNW